MAIRTVLLRCSVLLICLSMPHPGIFARSALDTLSRGESESVVGENSRVRITVGIRSGVLVSERLETTTGWAREYSATPAIVEGDGGFGLDVMYTGWSAPRALNNGENPVMLGVRDFRFERSELSEQSGGTRLLSLFFRGDGNPLLLRITYALDADAFYVRRTLSVRDTSFGRHFLRWFWPRLGSHTGVTSVAHPGGFGQPVAVVMKNGSAFFGTEYPAAQNESSKFAEGSSLEVRCGHEVGQLIGADWLTSEPVVAAVAPNRFVKQWFFTYLDRIRVAPLKPYALYNTWYDLRSPDYPRIPLGNVMSEQSALKMVRLLRENMIEKYGIHLDAFVLDDGWDVYQSDWLLRKEQWPNGLKPLVQELAKTQTSLGVWFGPTGGYSFRKYRVEWMKANGYEAVGDQLCVAGAKYGALLRQRTTDFTASDGVAYYKWDGIQFSCSEPTHGHATDIYSRRAVMESVVSMCASVREKNPNTFLNITSGTWMSPWWVKYANTIWMQGQDYGYADVPSLSQRDGAITYRDFVLYDGLRQKNLWFPIANLMTHGIIKGKLELLGSPEEPLDKFTDDVLMYFARGVAMYELYISPDILSEGEWGSIAGAMRWARDRFPLLMTTEMVGGNPMKGEAYGYAHFSGRRGIIAARNPVIERTTLKLVLTPELGLDPAAEQLVLERVYPSRWVSPNVIRAGETIELPLEGYETAVYEISPLRDAQEPLFAGVILSAEERPGSKQRFTIHSVGPEARVLNPERLIDGRRVENEFRQLASDVREEKLAEPVTNASVQERLDLSATMDIHLQVNPTSRDAVVAVLVTPEDAGEPDVEFRATVSVDGRETQVRAERQEGRSQWFSFPVLQGRRVCSVTLRKSKGTWGGKVRAQVWYVGRQAVPTKQFEVTQREERNVRPLPPVVLPAGEVVRNVKLGDLKMEIQ